MLATLIQGRATDKNDCEPFNKDQDHWYLGYNPLMDIIYYILVNEAD